MKKNAFYTKGRGQSDPWLSQSWESVSLGGYPLASEKHGSEAKPPEVNNRLSSDSAAPWKMLWVEDR